jgi:hypothetical protein
VEEGREEEGRRGHGRKAEKGLQMEGAAGVEIGVGVGVGMVG